MNELVTFFQEGRGGKEVSSFDLHLLPSHSLLSLCSPSNYNTREKRGERGTSASVPNLATPGIPFPSASFSVISPPSTFLPPSSSSSPPHLPLRPSLSNARLSAFHLVFSSDTSPLGPYPLLSSSLSVDLDLHIVPRPPPSNSPNSSSANLRSIPTRLRVRSSRLRAQKSSMEGAQSSSSTSIRASGSSRS